MIRTLFVRRFFLGLLWLASTAFLPAFAQDTVVQEFSGNGSTTTARFKVPDRWEVRWNARQVVSVAVLTSDGTIVAGAAGVLRGSLFVPLRGQYYLKISDGTAASSQGPQAPAASTAPVPGNNASASSSEPELSWHVQVVALGKSAPSNQALTVYTPYFTVPDSALLPFVPPPPPTLSDDQIHTLVTVKGDNTQGAGFLMRSPEGTFVVTHLHLLAANPNLKIVTSSGAMIKTLALKGAVDRDLALFTIQDDHYSYLPLPSGSSAGVELGDQVITPYVWDAAEVPLGKVGMVNGVGPTRIDFDNTLGRGGEVGAPVILVKNGTVLALMTAGKQVDLSDDIAKSWPANANTGPAGNMPYFGVRLSGVPGWETYDQDRFLAETLFLKQFHQDTRCLDSYLNGRRRRVRSGNDEGGPPDSRYFLNDAKLSAAHDTYRQQAIEADRDQQLDAAKELLFDLEGLADTDMDTLQANHFYSFNQAWAREEMAYRMALKKELDDLSNNIVRLNNIARLH